MKKLTVLTALLLIFTLVLGGCTKDSGSDGPQSEPSFVLDSTEDGVIKITGNGAGRVPAASGT